MNVKFRKATSEDQAHWIVMRQEFWPNCPLDRHKFEMDQLLASDGIVVVAIVEITLVGFAEVSLRTDHVEGTVSTPVPYLEGWYVRPEYRGMGIGQGLLKHVEQWAIQRGFIELASDAELEAYSAIGSHMALGFREVGKSVHFIKNLKTKGN